MPLESALVSPRSALPRSQPQVGECVRELRQLLGYPQEQFAAVLGVSFSPLNRWEKGRMPPSPLALQQIERVVAGLSHVANPTRLAGHQDFEKKYSELRISP